MADIIRSGWPLCVLKYGEYGTGSLHIPEANGDLAAVSGYAPLTTRGLVANNAIG
jgi:hypothetical protein